MRRAHAWGAASLVAIGALLPVVASTPAQAGVFGLDLKIASYDWTPRTGNVTVTARAECPKRMWRADFVIELDQRSTTASGRKNIRCDGGTHTVTMTLDPKRGRFHPGAATMQLTTTECISDMCASVAYQQEGVRLPPPGHSHRGAK